MSNLDACCIPKILPILGSVKPMQEFLVLAAIFLTQLHYMPVVYVTEKAQCGRKILFSL